MTNQTPSRSTRQNIANGQASPSYSQRLFSPSSIEKRTYYDKGPSADYRNVLQRNQEIEHMLSKEEIFKIQNALLEAKPN